MKILESKWPFILYSLMITGLSLYPRDHIPDMGWTVMDGVDKVIHALFYGLMYLLWHWMDKPKRWSAPIWGILLCTFWGIAMEFLQAWMSLGRSFELTDIFANAIGVLIAFIIFRNK